MNNYPPQFIVSMLIAKKPKKILDRLVLSASDAVWDVEEDLPSELRKHLKDDIGNDSPHYGGFLFLKDEALLKLLEKFDYYAGFRGVGEGDVKYTDCVNKISPDELPFKVNLAGWDIVKENGWHSASCSGHFPLDPFDGKIFDRGVKINKYSLFDDYNECLKYVKINNSRTPKRPPWYPVSIYLDDSTMNRLNLIS